MSSSTDTNRSAQMELDRRFQAQMEDRRMPNFSNYLRSKQPKIEKESSARIYRVPPEHRQGKESAYTPSLVSIGPLHSRDEHLPSQMKSIKYSYLNSLFFQVYQRGGPHEGKDFAMLKHCVDQMEKHIPDVKKFYGGEIEDIMGVNTEMLVVDGCFILELLRKYTEDVMQKQWKEAEKSEVKRRSSHTIFECSSLLNRLVRRNKDSSKKSSKSQKNNDERQPDPIFSFPLTRIAVQQDLVLLENQLPFFVLKDLFNLTLGHLPGHLHLSEYILNYFHKILNIGHEKSINCLPKKPKFSTIHDQHEVVLEGLKGYDHILHFLHSHYTPTSSDDDNDPPDHADDSHNEFMPSASRLDASGVKFEGIEDQFKVQFDDNHSEFMPSASSLDTSGVKFEGVEDQFDVQFDPRWYTCRRARFAIPSLHIDDSTELVLRNFIAYEKCLPGVLGYFSSYASLMDKLINTEKDVQVLQEARVINNFLGTSTKASDLFNNLCKEYVTEGSHFLFAETCKAVSCYNKQRWLAFLLMTTQYLKRKWSANPWTFVGFCVALVVFVMQVIQFITSYTG